MLQCARFIIMTFLFCLILTNCSSKHEEIEYEDIHLPANTSIPVYLGVLSIVFGFAMTWHIVWLSVLSFLGILGALFARFLGKDEHVVITAEEVKKIEEANRMRVQAL